MDLSLYKECFAYKNGVYIDTQGKVTPCCYFRNKLPLNVLRDWNTYKTELEKLDIESGCQNCIKLDNAGVVTSHRMFFEENIRNISISVDNLCNIKCTSCNPGYSTQWISDAIKLNQINATQQKYFLKLSQEGYIKLDICKNIIETCNEPIKIIFYGGEPTINPKVIEFLDWLIRLPYADQIIISFVTNGTTILNNMEYYITKFKEVIIGISIDGIAEQSNYLRYGSEWNVLKDNLLYYNSLDKKYKNYNYYIHLTLSVMNIYYFYEYCRWFNNNLTQCRLTMTKLFSPDYQSIDVLTPKEKSTIIARNLNLIDKLNSNGVINLKTIRNEYESLAGASTYIQKHALLRMNPTQTLAKLKSLDGIRNTCFETTFPEIFDILSKKHDTQNINI
jgi:hypothetical protein